MRISVFRELSERNSRSQSPSEVKSYGSGDENGEPATKITQTKQLYFHAKQRLQFLNRCYRKVSAGRYNRVGGISYVRSERFI